jgi:hypothetical protein
MRPERTSAAKAHQRVRIRSRHKKTGGAIKMLKGTRSGLKTKRKNGSNTLKTKLNTIKRRRKGLNVNRKNSRKKLSAR